MYLSLLCCKAKVNLKPPFGVPPIACLLFKGSLSPRGDPLILGLIHLLKPYQAYQAPGLSAEGPREPQRPGMDWVLRPCRSRPLVAGHGKQKDPTTLAVSSFWLLCLHFVKPMLYCGSIVGTDLSWKPKIVETGAGDPHRTNLLFGPKG